MKEKMDRVNDRIRCRVKDGDVNIYRKIDKGKGSDRDKGSGRQRHRR